jgi:PAS domain S-box-containing protein
MMPKGDASTDRPPTVPRQYLTVQHAVSRILAEAPTLPEASLRLLHAVCDSLSWEVGALWERDRTGGFLRCVAVWCAPHTPASEFVAVTQRLTFAPGVGLPGRIWSSGAPAWVPDVAHDANFPRAPYAAKEGLHAAFGFPIARGGEILGTLEFFSHEIRQPDEELLDLMTSIGHQIGQFIERQLAQEAIRNSEARKAAILESALDAIITMDSRGRIQEFNPAAERIFGYASADVLGRELADLLVPERLRAQHRRGLEHYLATGEGPVLGTRIEMPALRADGTEFPVELSITLVHGPGPPMFTGYLRDVTARKQAELEREGLLQRERDARREAEHASRVKDEFLATLSHELRTPLTAILGWARLLRAGTLEPASAERAIETIERNAALQTRLVADLLDVSRVLSGKFRLEMRATDLRAVVDAALESLRPASDARGILVTAMLDPHVGVILADPDRLQQVVWNLLSNAIKFTPSGGRIEVRTVRRGADVEIAVSDTGQGIDAAFLPFVFDRFRQADGSITRSHPGLGLGLAIVRHLVEMHGGTVAASSEGAERGAVFTVRIPTIVGRGFTLSACESTTQDSPESRPTAPPTSLLADTRILVVDDDADARRLVSAVLADAGAHVTAVTSTAEALAALERAPVDLLLSDIEMPREDGYALIIQVRAMESSDANRNRIPAAALTGHARGADRDRALAAGYDRHIAKPFEPEELVAAVADLTGRSADRTLR